MPKLQLIITLLSVFIYQSSVLAEEPTRRYRGLYTYGHETNSFCPEINSQCYWLDPQTNNSIKQQLKSLSAQYTTKPYQAVCIVVEASINPHQQSATVNGFAAKYDGFISITHLFAQCNETDIVTQGDLQHHRWILESINGVNIKSINKVPELDFGEQLFVSGNTGCNSFRGQAVLHDSYFIIEKMMSTRMLCAPKHNELELTIRNVLNKDSTIILDNNKKLSLSNTKSKLIFRLQDWVR